MALLCSSTHGNAATDAALRSGLAVGELQQPAAGAVPPPQPEPLGHTGWIDWNGDNFFRPCGGDCAISIYGGSEVTTSMTRIFFVEYPPSPFWKWHWRNSNLIAAAFSRRLVTFWNALNLEPEVGIGQRFGQMHATEFWGAISFRWTQFPWNNYLRTTIAITDGLSAVTKLDNKEMTLNSPKAGSYYLNFFSPSITFALPQYKAYELVFRWHHRSGIFGLINGVHKGAQFFTAGIRVHF